jgi:glycosyltransferase involved in cell wall biosynthesis
VEHYYPARRCRDIFVGCAVDRTLFHPVQTIQKESLLKKYGISGPYILFVGSLEPRKNLGFLLSLMPELWRISHTQLVVVGASGWKNSHIKALVEAEDFPRESVVFCGFVPETDLVLLYNAASCFVSASLNEGFGMPQLEALLCECPVVTARNSAMTEVAEGKHGTVCITGYDPKTWIDTICNTLEERPKVCREEFDTYDWRIIIKRLMSRLSKEKDL